MMLENKCQTPAEIEALMVVSVEEVQKIQGYMQSIISLDTLIAVKTSILWG